MDSSHLLVAVLIIIVHGTLRSDSRATINSREEGAGYWNGIAQEDLLASLRLKPNVNVAKNVIIFLGDGMGVSTITAGRILKGQIKGQNGEEENLIFDTFPHASIVKTYNVDQQTPDSAGTATAFLCGVKTNAGLIGVTAAARRGIYSSQQGKEVDSILKWSQREGKAVGIVTTARITHATPAAAYASTVEREWEGDASMVDVTGDCPDIARQLIVDNSDIQVVMGGGRRYFVPMDSSDADIEKDDKNNRLDGRNLITEWILDKVNRDVNHVVLNDTGDLRNMDPGQLDYVLGLFQKGHMTYDVDRDTTENGEPSLAEMTEMAIKVLQKDEDGFFLLVEGGRIDHGHHASQAKRALYEVVALDRAMETAVNLTNEDDTLIVVTADHSHVFTMGGYPSRGNDILGLTDGDRQPTDLQPTTTLLYGNGPGYRSPRENLTNVDIHANDYKQQSGVPITKETHGGEDVVVYARGPMAHLFRGVHEQNYVAHVMAYASCVGANKDHCNSAPSTTPKPTNADPGGPSTFYSLSATLILVIMDIFCRL